jgi:hypothetical protein
MYSDNIIFFDGEFTSLDPNEGRLLSLALVKPNGESLYLELDPGDAPFDPWVLENVTPYFTGDTVSDEEAVKQIKAFVGSGLPYLMAKVNQFDWIFLAKLLGLMKRGEETVFLWLPIDFASILYARGIDPATPSEQLAEKLGVELPEGYQNHHALSDAQLLRLLYQKLAEE